MENTSGQGAAAAVPPEIDRWNWGAFLLTWIWGIGNNTFIALLSLVPFANLVMPFVLGAKGSAWAWRNKKWDSADQFRNVQRKWALWGVVVWLGFAALFVAMFFTITAVFRNTEVAQLALAAAAANPQVAQLTGKPMSTGTPSGEISESSTRGSASIAFSVQGPNGRGTVFVEAKKELGQWKIERMVLQDEGAGRRIDLVPPLGGTGS